MSHYEVIVIGVGCMGASACASIAQRGVKVLGIEQYTIPHDMGSSGYQSRIFRIAYYEHADYVPLLKEAHAGWHELNQVADQTVFHETGGLYMGPQGGDFVEHSQSSAKAHDLEFERMDAKAIRNRFPVFNIPDSFAGIFEQPAGIVFPERAIEAQARIARKHGAELLEDTRVNSWKEEDGCITVESSGGTFTCDRLVICSGAWTQKLCPDLPLSVSRQVIGWMQTSDPELITWPNLVTWAIELPDQSLLYGFPLMDQLDGPAGFKMARHLPGETSDPDTMDRTPREDEESSFLEYAKQHLPSIIGEITDLKICLYTNTPDKHFIIDHHPEHDNVFIAAGFSGHGFKFQPIVGRILADLAIDGCTGHPIEFLSMDRFKTG